MIHQFIFAYPRPGMTEQEFQHYWLTVHAPNYAMKIPQIRKYKVDTRVALSGETGDPLWSGVAEIWLENDEEQLLSLQSKEFLQGARLDEPNWAAFWRTVCLDTLEHIVIPGPEEARAPEMVKLLVISKRREGLPLSDFRAYALGTHAAKVAELPGLVRYEQNHVRDGFYGIGEALLDLVEQLSFHSAEAALAARESLQQAVVDSDYRLFTEERYIHRLLVQEHWLIGPEARAYSNPAAATP
jgi:uncharacterized protein (TIGR02118 family)